MYDRADHLPICPSLVIRQRLNTVAEISELCRRGGMNRIRAPAARADKPRAVAAIAGELETLPINETLFKTSAHQATIVGNAVERAELVRAHIVTRGKMTAEMLEVLPAPWATEAITIEPGVNRRDRMKLTRIQIRLSIARMTSALTAVASSAVFRMNGASRRIGNFESVLARRLAPRKVPPCLRPLPKWTSLQLRKLY